MDEIDYERRREDAESGRAPVGGAVDALMQGRHPAHFELEIADEEAHFTVRRFVSYEALDRLYEASIEATFGADVSIDERDLLGKDLTVAIERDEEARHFRGIIRQAKVRREQEHQVLLLDAVPALWLLDETFDSRVYQDLTVPDLVHKVVDEVLGARGRRVRSELIHSYLTHEYLVQYRESHFGFVSRLMREEGIFFYFDHDSDNAKHEVLVLADSNTNRPLLRAAHDGVVVYEALEDRREGRDVAFYVHREQRVGSTDAVIGGYDWTNPRLGVRHARTERGSWEGLSLERYEHHHAVRYHGYEDGAGSYTSHTADRQSRIRCEQLDLDRSRWSVSTTVVTACPGHMFELRGTDVHDGRYMVVGVDAVGEAGTAYSNSLRAIPLDMPYRPSPAERVVMPGPETAVVVGPAGEEIHVDQHGRVKVQFHWDRRGQRNEHSSVWIRVAQAWSGLGWGSMFIPRIGMEVIVSFLGGDPDRPIVTGCVYNGQNRPPYTLPDEKTKSTIKTNSSLGGGGSNELRFEDKKGNEEVYIHAQKDLDEVVEHDHTTRVKNCQTNTVDVNQSETVGKNQTLRVKNDRKKTVENDEVNVIEANRTTSIKLDEKLTVEKGERTVSVQTGTDTEEYLGGRNTTVAPDDELTVSGKRTAVIGGDDEVQIGGHYKLVQASVNELLIDGKVQATSVGTIELDSGPGAARVELAPAGKVRVIAEAEVCIQVGATTITVNGGGVTINCPTFRVNGQALAEINGAIVKIN